MTVYLLTVMIEKELGTYRYGSYTLHGTGTGTRNNGVLYYAMYCTHYTGTEIGTGNHCFLLCLSSRGPCAGSGSVQCV